jgi:radical SAM protein with 4Fe4S-binding SPASM domain
MSTEIASDEADKGNKIGKSLWRVLRWVPQFTRTSRHLWSLLKHSTPRKIANLLLVEAEYRLRRTNVRGHPYIIIVDPLNVCNLRCPLCPTGIDDLGRKGMQMSWETFTRVIDQAAPYAYEVNLHNWGESILHPHIFDMIEYSNSRNIATNLSVNLNRISEENIDRLITSGLEYLVVSIDGISNDIYIKYRVKGNLDTVLTNLETLIRRRTELGSSTPFIEWQFLLFKHNAHEVEKAREVALAMGVNKFRIISPGVPFDSPDPAALRREWFIQDSADDEAGYWKPLAKSCMYLYRSFTVNPDGKTAPCCIVYGNRNDFGDACVNEINEIWNNEKYISARSQYTDNGRVTTPTVCDRCHIFAKRTNPPEEFLKLTQTSEATSAAEGDMKKKVDC